MNNNEEMNNKEVQNNRFNAELVARGLNPENLTIPELESLKEYYNNIRESEKEVANRYEQKANSPGGPGGIDYSNQIEQAEQRVENAENNFGVVAENIKQGRLK